MPKCCCFCRRATKCEEESKNLKSNKSIHDQKTVQAKGRSSGGPCVIDATLTGGGQQNQYDTTIYKNERHFNRVKSTHDYEDPHTFSDQKDERENQTQHSKKEGVHKGTWFKWPKRQIDDSGIYDTPNPILRKLTLLRKKPESKGKNEYDYVDRTDVDISSSAQLSSTKEPDNIYETVKNF